MSALLLCLVLAKAPVPPGSECRELTTEHLVGEWDYAFLSQRGKAFFLGSGEYLAWLVGTDGAVYEYLGYWAWDGEALLLWEHRPGANQGSFYRLPLKAADYPVLKSSCYGSSLTFSNPRPLPGPRGEE